MPGPPLRSIVSGRCRRCGGDVVACRVDARLVHGRGCGAWASRPLFPFRDRLRAAGSGPSAPLPSSQVPSLSGGRIRMASWLMTRVPIPCVLGARRVRVRQCVGGPRSIGDGSPTMLDSGLIAAWLLGEAALAGHCPGMILTGVGLRVGMAFRSPPSGVPVVPVIDVSWRMGRFRGFVAGFLWPSDGILSGVGLRVGMAFSGRCPGPALTERWPSGGAGVAGVAGGDAAAPFFPSHARVRALADDACVRVRALRHDARAREGTTLLTAPVLGVVFVSPNGDRGDVGAVVGR